MSINCHRVANCKKKITTKQTSKETNKTKQDKSQTTKQTQKTIGCLDIPINIVTLLKTSGSKVKKKQNLSVFIFMNMELQQYHFRVKM